MSLSTVKIKTPCPSCGFTELFLGPNGNLFCSNPGCPEPDTTEAINKLREENAQLKEEIEEYLDGGW